MSTRQYYPIWHALKSLSRKDAETKGISITANRLMHPRIIKAVTKEKWMDLGFKITLDPTYTILSHTRNNAILTFYLTYKKDITIADL